MATREELLRQRLDRELEKKAQAEKVAKQIKQQLSKAEKKTENRRRYAFGGHLLDALRNDTAESRRRFYELRDLFDKTANKTRDDIFEACIVIFDQTLTRNIDRRAFDLAELPPKSKRKTAKKQPTLASKSNQTSSSPAQPSQAPPSRRTSLPPSLVAATVVLEASPGVKTHNDTKPGQNGDSKSPARTASDIVVPAASNQPSNTKPVSKPLPERHEKELMEEFNL